MKFFARVVALSAMAAVASVDAFVQPTKTTSPRRTSSALTMSNQFDVSRPVFDFLSLRSVRGDALIRYGALNQSEPLRITLYALLSLTCLAAPALSEAVGYDAMSGPAVVGSAAAAAVNSGLLARECSRRNKQLVRMEKELNTELLPIRLPANVLADQSFTKPVALRDLRGLSAPPRIIALCGTTEKLKEAMEGLVVLGQRLRQATVYVVAIPMDGQEDVSSRKSRYPWLADAYDLGAWRNYFDELVQEDDADSSFQFRWFGLNSGGRSFGSGQDEIPQWLQVLGQHLRPTSLLNEDDSPSNVASVIGGGSDTVDSSISSETGKLLRAQTEFYQALTTGDKEAMKGVFSDSQSPGVSEVLSAGGRIDDWNVCLADGARPQDMLTSGSDVSVSSDKMTAFTTNVEFPASAGFDSATLLAVQEWRNENGDWKLYEHQTIPWSPEAKAQGTLRCDCRGCVALTRARERRTFGGLVG